MEGNEQAKLEREGSRIWDWKGKGNGEGEREGERERERGREREGKQKRKWTRKRKAKSKKTKATVIDQDAEDEAAHSSRVDATVSWLLPFHAKFGRKGRSWL
jgi:hypothetical protein